MQPPRNVRVWCPRCECNAKESTQTHRMFETAVCVQMRTLPGGQQEYEGPCVFVVSIDSLEDRQSVVVVELGIENV